jgi:hypothetical protein
MSRSIPRMKRDVEKMLPEDLQRLMMKHGLTARELGHKINYSASTIRHYSTGCSPISDAFIDKCREAGIV